MSEEMKLEIGGIVVYIDEHRREHNAMVTCIHGDPEGRLVVPRRKSAKELTDEERKSDRWQVDDNEIYAYELNDIGAHAVDYGEPGTNWPCINLVLVSPNEECQDQYGRQLQRHTSVVHQSNSSAQGFCFRFLTEKLDPMMRQPTVS